MYKYVVPMVRMDSLSFDEFLAYWQTEHAPVAAEIAGLVRYHQVVPTDPAASDFDGVAEVYFEDLEELHAAFGTLDGRHMDTSRENAQWVMQDIVNFLDLGGVHPFIGEERIHHDELDGQTDACYKYVAFLNRQEGTTHAEFLDYWETEHTPLACDIDGLRRYSTVVPTDPEPSPFDGIAELYFGDLDALQEALGRREPGRSASAEASATAAVADLDTFVSDEQRPALVGQETVVKDEMGS